MGSTPFVSTVTQIPSLLKVEDPLEHVGLGQGYEIQARPLLLFTENALTHLSILETHRAPTAGAICLHAGWRGLTALFT